MNFRARHPAKHPRAPIVIVLRFAELQHSLLALTLDAVEALRGRDEDTTILLAARLQFRLPDITAFL